MKNWIDRIFSYGFAYGFLSNLSGRKAMIVYTAEDTPEERKNEPVVHHLIHKTIFEFTKLKPLKPIVVYDCEEKPSAEFREMKLKEIHSEIEKIEDRETYKTPFDQKFKNVKKNL